MTDTILVPAGSVEYSVEEASTSISELISMLKEAQEDGATHVVLESGNYRGAKYLKIETSYEWVDE